ncbi:MAG: LysE family translocator [Pseudomonadota bacterium]
MNLPVSGSTLAMFSGAVLMLMLSPGPNMTFVIAHAASLGWRGGLAAAAGIALADILLTVVSAAGIGAVIAAWPGAFDMLRIAGALYLLRLAWLAWTRPSSFVPAQAGRPMLAAVCGRAALNSLLNPKALLFFVLFLPGFADPSRGSPGLQLATLGFTLTVIATIFHSLLALASDAIIRAAGSRALRVERLSRVLAAMFLALSVRLLAMTAP